MFGYVYVVIITVLCLFTVEKIKKQPLHAFGDVLLGQGLRNTERDYNS